jgi:uncharacterized protein
LAKPSGISAAGVSEEHRARGYRSVTKAPFERALVRKGQRALQVARLALHAGDNDSAVSGSYYAMFDFAQAALLRAGVTEGKLPRAHSGIIEAFCRHAVQTGQFDRELATQLSRTESLRMTADYTGVEIELNEAKEVVQNAEFFVQTVERVFSLDKPPLAKEWRELVAATAARGRRRKRGQSFQ